MRLSGETQLRLHDAILALEKRIGRPFSLEERQGIMIFLEQTISAEIAYQRAQDHEAIVQANREQSRKEEQGHA